MKCRRPSCQFKARPGRDQGYCHKHYRSAAVRGYFDPGPALERLELLRSRGVTLKMLEEYGLTKFCVMKIALRSRIQAKTVARIFSVPVPDELVPSLASVDSLGTVRRLQALCAIGYTQKRLGAELGMPQRQLSALIYQERVSAVTALKVARVFERLCMVPGPSELSRMYARRQGWAPPLAWSNIDDPDEAPDFGEAVVLRFPDRYREVRELESHPENIARRLGISEKALKRMLIRYGMQEAS